MINEIAERIPGASLITPDSILTDKGVIRCTLTGGIVLVSGDWKVTLGTVVNLPETIVRAYQEASNV